MSDLRSQLVDYLDHVVQRVADVEEIQQQLPYEPDVVDLRPRRPRRRLLALVGVAAAILVVVAIVSLADRDDAADLITDSRDSVPADSVDATTAPSTSAAPSPTTPPAGPVEVSVEWTEVTDGNPPVLGPTDQTLTELFVINDLPTPRAAIVAGPDDGPFSLWTTEHGTEWQRTEISLPSHPGGLRIEPTQTGYWLIGFRPTALWYSPDLHSDWETINLDGLAQDAPFPLTWEDTSIESVASVGDTTLVVARYEASFDWDTILGIDPGTYDEYDYAYDGDEESEDEIERDPNGIVTLSGRTEISEGRIEEPLLRFIPSTSAEGLSIIDADTGETAFFFPNVGEFDWADVVGFDVWPRFQHEFFTLMEATPEGLEETGPWVGSLGRLSSPQGMALLELNDSVIVATSVGEERESAIYLTENGTTFEPIPGLPQGYGGFPQSLVNVEYDPTSGYLYTWLVDGFFGGSVSDHWISPDAVNWTRLQIDPDLVNLSMMGRSELRRLDDGWLLMKRNNVSVTEVYVSVDGAEWHAIDPQPLPRNSGFIHSWGNRLLVVGEDSNLVGTVEFRGG